jgi:hypothetical protein
MKTKLSLAIIPCLIIYLLACASLNPTNGQWEGISGDTLRIIISEFFPLEENVTDEYISKILKQRLDQRASLIIASYISINLSRNKVSTEVDVTLNSLINKSISQGKLINFHCRENNYCTAYADYDISEIIKNLSIINNQ